MDNIQFVPVKESEAGLIGQLRQKAWSSTYRGIYPDEMMEKFDYNWHKERDLMRMRNPQFHHYFIQRNGVSVGYLTLKEGPILLIYSLYLLPEAQKQGIGKRAFAFVEDYCTQRSIDTFSCHCQPDNTNAMDFYRHMGGQIVARDEGNKERWQDTVVFQFSL